MLQGVMRGRVFDFKRRKRSCRPEGIVKNGNLKRRSFQIEMRSMIVERNFYLDAKTRVTDQLITKDGKFILQLPQVESVEVKTSRKSFYGA